ncbi:MAG: hypothetical protein GEV05_09060 [Betaproteobacteria bacterium]|nr:hypothetical protein [Betaproteobacteria bacterium]
MRTNALRNEVIERVVAKYDLNAGLHGRWRPICGHFGHVRLANRLANDYAGSGFGCDGRAQTGSQLDSPFAGANVYVREFPANSRAPMKYPG